RVCDGDADHLRVHTAGTVAGLHRDVVDVVGACVGWVLEVRDRDEIGRASCGDGCELSRVHAAGDRVAQRLCRQVGVGGGDRRHRGRIVGDAVVRRGVAGVAGYHLVVVHVCDGDADQLCVYTAGPVADLHRDVVDVVGACVGWVLEVRDRD